MRRFMYVIFTISLSVSALVIYAQQKSAGEKCTVDTECNFDSTCRNGVCIKKKEFDFGNTEKTGKPCSIDAECINAGKCVKGIDGSGRCSGQ